VIRGRLGAGFYRQNRKLGSAGSGVRFRRSPERPQSARGHLNGTAAQGSHSTTLSDARDIINSRQRTEDNANLLWSPARRPLKLSPPAAHHPVDGEAACRQVRRHAAPYLRHGCEQESAGEPGIVPMRRSLERCRPVRPNPQRSSASTESSIATLSSSDC